MRKNVKVWAFILCGILAGISLQPLISSDNIFKNTQKFDKVLNTAFRNYLTEVDADKLTEEAIRAILGNLDPHSAYLTKEEMKEVNEDFSGSFDGIGVEFDIVNDTLIVVTPLTDGPSEKVGIEAGDKIIKVDGKSVIGISRTEVPKKLKGPKGTEVVLDIKRRSNKELLQFKIKRDKIPNNSVRSKFMIDGTDIGVIYVDRFMSTTNTELNQALDELSSKGMKKLVLDLRFNPGGFLDQAFRMAEEFLSKGDTIVYTKGRRPEFCEDFVARGGHKWEKLPIIVLINAASASASEIVSGAIQDRDRGLVVGVTSFGKGLVQRQIALGDGSAFRLTISKYYTPSGRCIQRKYEDKKDYRNLVGRLNLDEGNYINDAMKKIKKQVEKFNKEAKEDKDKINIDSLPLYKTRLGRTVFGAGGITPDVIVKNDDTLTDLTVEFRKKSLFVEFVEEFLVKHKTELKSKYDNDFSGFIRNFAIDDKIMADFRKLAEQREIKWNDEQAKIDMDYIKVSIKMNIARIIWDRNKMSQVFASHDKQLMEAIKYFDEAIKVMNKK